MGHFFKTQPTCLPRRPGQPQHLKYQPNPTQNFWTNPTQPTKVFTRPNPTHHSGLQLYGILGYTENFIQQLLHVTDKFTLHSTSQLSMKVIIQLQYSLTDSRVFHDVKNITQSSLHPTQPNKPKIKKTLTQPNPTHGWTQPMTNSGAG